MAKKPGLPKKYAKLGFKKGWIAYRKAKRARGTTTTKKKVGTKMATAKKTVRKTVTGAAQKIKYVTRKQKMTPVELMIFSLIAAGGGIISSMIVNFVPFIKDMKPIMKSLSQMGVGVAGIVFIPKKADFLKPFFGGAGIAGTFGLIQKLSAGRFQVLAGDSGRTLSDQEIAALISGGYIEMQGPAGIGLNGPAEMGKTINPAMSGQARNPAFMGEFRISE